MTFERPPRRPPGPPPPERYRPQHERPPAGTRSGPPRRRPPPPPQSHALRNTLIALSVLGVIVGGGVMALSLLFPGDVVRDRLVAEVKARTGRDLTVNGPATFSAVPTAHVSLADVTLSAPPGMEGPPLAAMRSVDVHVALWPLLWREVIVESVVLKDPVISLAVDGSGRNNWEMSRTAAFGGSPVRLAQAAGETATDAGPGAGPGEPLSMDVLKRHDISNVSLRDLTIENGTLRYADARTDKAHEATGISARVAVHSLQSPATAKGAFDYRGENIAFTLELGAIEPLLAHGSSRVALKLTSRPFTANYEGTVFPANSEAEGSLTVDAASIAKTAAWLGASVPADADFGTLNFTGQLRRSAKVYALTNATLTANGATATGHLSLDAGAARPLLRGELQIADLDLNAFVAPAKALAPDAQTPGGGEGGSSIENLIEQPPKDAPAPGTRVNGYTARGGWNEDPIRLTALTAADADLKLSIGSLLYKDIKFGASRIALGLADSVLKATIEDAVLYGGHGRGFVVLDGRSAETAHVGLNLTLDNIAMRPLLQDAAKLDWIEGQGKASIAVAGSGPHQRAVIESLAGKADLKVAQGAVRGIDINRMAENLADGRFKGLKPEPGDKTAFSSLTATWQIQDGVASNNDLRLTSDIVQVTGSGSVLLPDRSLDYTVRPKLAGSEADDEKGLAGIEVPVRVSGSWEKPSYKADVGSAVQELGKRFKGKDAGEIVDELVGKDSKGESKAKKLLDKLFR
ncbi:MAG: AsmA family protein [Hyphomicrobiaceae bacterium]|nr:AsmA family protein [Hyphomicrobiaceae bacterium]